MMLTLKVKAHPVRIHPRRIIRAKKTVLAIPSSKAKTELGISEIIHQFPVLKGKAHQTRILPNLMVKDNALPA